MWLFYYHFEIFTPMEKIYIFLEQTLDLFNNWIGFIKFYVIFYIK